MTTFANAQLPLVATSQGLSRIAGWVQFFLAALFYAVTILFCNALQVLSLVLIPFSRTAFRTVNRTLANTWWGWCVTGAEKVFGVEPVFTGDDVPPRENAIVFANHQQMPDILLLMMLAQRKDRLGDMKWFVKDPIKYVPGIGWGMHFLDCLFVKRDWLADKKRILGTFQKFFANRIPVWLVTFVEGTRITPTKLAKSQLYCKRKGLPQMQHVLIPRTRGFTAAVEGLTGHVDAVYDVTLGYEGGVPNISHMMRGLVPRVHIDVRRFALSDLPKAEPELARWLQDRFVRKDALLGELFAHGRFPKD